ncbi:MAG: cobalt ECF transporter T component CbiQ [Candidatus Ornithomonoglobus sp.]
MLIDKEAYRSRLSGISPGLKMLMSLYCIINCIAADSMITSLMTLFIMSAVICAVGGLKVKRLIHFLKIPLFFTVIGTAALAVEAGKTDYIVSFLGIGVTRSGALYALGMFFRCMGSVSAMYFLSLTTPVTAMFTVLRRTPLPGFFVETAELVYRYIFVLFDSYKKINVAQESRLGYNTLRAKYRSTALIGGAVFIKAMEQAQRSFTAMESRGYTGEIKVLPGEYTLQAYHIAAAVIICALLTASGVIF